MSCKQHRYLLMALDPVFVGTGGYRLGRVDLSIVREPGTNIPQIPGTSLSGAARYYAAVRNGDPQCAGQGRPKEGYRGHCGDCPVCYTFGSLRMQVDGEQKAYSGVVNLFDARILFFPVHSMAGPVWVSTPARLQEAGLTPSPKVVEGDALCAAIEGWEGNNLNLGWLLLDVQNGASIGGVPAEWEAAAEWQAVRRRLVLTSEKLYGQIVNSNLEVRTSVSIDPLTGAAEEGALFTYEAIPRATLLTADVVQDDFRGKFPRDKAQARGLGDSPLSVVKSGFELMEWLGVGGMGTRGFGRLRVVGEPVETTARWTQEEEQT